VTKTERRKLSAGLLQSTGILSQLRAACLTLVSSDPELIRSMMIAVSCDGVADDADQAVRRLAEENCVVADVERRGGAMVIRLERRDGPFAGKAAER
jgi:hypothetical protein